MKKLSKWAGLMAALSVGLVSTVSAQQADEKAKADRALDNDAVQADQYGTPDRGLTRSDSGPSQRGGVEPANKASNLVGMEVRNQQNELLGEIKDIVVDLPSGKISYAVLGVGGFLGIGEKLIAIPPSAFTTSDDHRKLVLNADKAKIEGAQGFVRTNWPDPQNPTWGSDAYWKTESGTSTSIESGTDKDFEKRKDDTKLEGRFETDQSKLDADLNREPAGARLDADLDRDSTSKSLARTDDRDSGMIFKGKIKAVSPENRTMTVEGASGTREFSFAEKARIAIPRNNNAKIVDLKPGYDVSVGYHEEGDEYIAHSVTKFDKP